MNISFWFSVLAAASLAGAYDFLDENFNKILSQEMVEMAEENLVVHPRARRDELTVNEENCRQRHKRNRLCCAEDTIESINDAQKPLCKECFKEVTGSDHGHDKRFEVFSCEQMEKRKNDMICVQECVGRKEQILNDDGSINPASLTSYLTKSFSNETWFPSAVDKIVSTCTAAAKAASELPTKVTTAGLKACNPSSLTLKYCLYREIQLNCPVDQIKDRSACDRFQEVKRGMDMSEPPPPSSDDN